MENEQEKVDIIWAEDVGNLIYRFAKDTNGNDVVIVSKWFWDELNND